MSPFARFITNALTGKGHSRRYLHTKTSIAVQVGILEDRVLLTLDANGWTELNPSADSRLIYVSSSTGNDSNDGLSEARPKQTINNAKQGLRNGFPDWLLLKAGDTFSEGVVGVGRSGRSADEPQVIASYGTGPRPVLHETSLQYHGHNRPLDYAWSYAVIRDLDFRGTYATNPTTPGNTFGIQVLEETQYVTIEGNSFTGYYDGVSIQKSQNRTGLNGNLTFRRNVVADNTHQGLLISKMDTLNLEGNVFDRNGYGPSGSTASILTHNVYFKDIQDLTVRNNIFARASNFGTKISSDTPGGFTNFRIESNLYYDNGLSLDHSAGSSGDVNTTFTHEHGVIQNNIFTELNKLSGGVQQDLAAYVLNTKDVRWSDNMFVHKSVVLGNPILVWGEHHQDITVQDTVIYDWNNGAKPSSWHLETNSSRIDGYTLTNNEIDLPAASYVDPSRTVGSYYATIGGANDPIAFLAAAKSLSRANWNSAFTADAVNDYIRAGFARVLATPVFSTPGDSQSSNPLHTVSWNTVDGSDGYEVWYTNLSTGQNPFVVAATESSSYTPATPLPIGRYRIWVRATQDDGPASPWSAPVTLQINTAPSLNALPPSGTNARPQLTWSPLPGAVRYEVWADNLTTKTSRIVHATNVTSTSFIPTADLGLAEHRFWVRASDAGNVASAWSVAQDYSRHNVTTSIEPVVFDGVTGRPTIRWNSVAGAVRYELWADNLTTGATRLIHDAQITETEFVPVTPLPFGNYRFWVRPVDTDGLAGFWSNPVVGTNAPAPLAPVLPTFSRRPTFSWAAIPGAVSYDLYIMVNGTLLEPSGLLTTNWTPTSELPIGDLKWWVRPSAVNNLKGPWSSVAEAHIGGRTTILQAGVPGNDPGRIGLFEWTAVTGASRYILHVERVDVGVVILESNLTTTSYTTAAPLAVGQYRVWVKAIDSSDSVSGIWTAVTTFSIVESRVQLSNPIVDWTNLAIPSMLENSPSVDFPRSEEMQPTSVCDERFATDASIRSGRIHYQGAERQPDPEVGSWFLQSLLQEALMSEADADLIDILMSQRDALATCR